MAYKRTLTLLVQVDIDPPEHLPLSNLDVSDMIGKALLERFPYYKPTVLIHGELIEETVTPQG